MTARVYGWRRPRVRVHLADHAPLTASQSAALPDAVDLRPLCPEVYDQGALGSCTANALAGAIEFLQLRQQREGVPTPEVIRPSRLCLYRDERAIEGTVAEDAGAVIGDGVAVLHDQGWVDETDWPYEPTLFAAAPPLTAMRRAVRLADFTSLPHDVDVIRSKLAQGFPVVFGVQVYQQIEDTTDGTITLPGPNAGASIGGHAMELVGYDHAARVFRVRNSWGTSWGQSGYGTIPYDYVGSFALCDEVYSLEAVRAP